MKLSEIPKDKIRIAFLLLIGILLVGATYYTYHTKDLDKQTAVAVAPLSSNFDGAAASKPVMPKGHGLNQTMRDPFAVPPDLAGYTAVNAVLPQTATKSNSSNNPVTSNSIKPSGQASPTIQKPILTGVVMGDGDKVAIIGLNGENRWYRVGSMIGAYKLLSIHSDSVTLWGPQGKLVLEVGR